MDKCDVFTSCSIQQDFRRTLFRLEHEPILGAEHPRSVIILKLVADRFLIYGKEKGIFETSLVVPMLSVLKIDAKISILVLRDSED